MHSSYVQNSNCSSLPLSLHLVQMETGYGKPKYCHYTQTDIKTLILLSNFHDQRTTSNPGQKFVLAHATQSCCGVCVKWKVHMPLRHILSWWLNCRGFWPTLLFLHDRYRWDLITGIWTQNSAAVSLIRIWHQACSFHLLIITAKPSLTALVMLCCVCACAWVYVEGQGRGTESRSASSLKRNELVNRFMTDNMRSNISLVTGMYSRTFLKHILLRSNAF